MDTDANHSQLGLAMISLTTALQSGAILLREGLEALLVIAALAAFLRRAGEGRRVWMLYNGALLAMLASVGAAVVFALYFNGAHDDRVEAVVMLVAAGLMLYMSGWMFLKQDPRAWQAGLQQAASSALGSGTNVSLAAIAFLAVFREGAETVLFLHALAGTNGGWSLSLIAGLLGAGAMLAVMFACMQWLAVRLPLRPLFLATSAFLFVMGLKFVGGALQELQEQAVLPVHSATLPGWLIDVGFNPTWEAIGTQVALAATALLSLYWLMQQRAGREARTSVSAAE